MEKRNTTDDTISDKTIEIYNLRKPIREVFARDKDFFQLIFRPEPSYLGETIPVSGDGRASDI